MRGIVLEVWDNKADWFVDQLQEELATSPGLFQAYVAYVDDEPAASGWVRYPGGNDPFASIWAGSTRERYRGRGLYAALVATRVQEAKRRGYRYVTIDAGPMSRPIVLAQDFELLTPSWPCRYVGAK